jgi:AcrR family transcriptional regulator
MSSPATSTRRRRAARGEGPRLREQLLNVAQELLLDPHRDLTIRAVASGVGVTTPSVYLHFADKDSLVEAVCLQAWDDLRSRMESALSSHDDPFQALRHLGAAYVSWGLEHAPQYQLVLLAPEAGERPQRRLAARQCLEYLTAAVARCVKAEVMRGDPQELALGMWSALHGYVALRVAHPELPWPDDLDALGEHIARMAGIGTALLTRIEASPPPRAPSSAHYAATLDEAVALLHQAEHPFSTPDS